MINYFFTPVFFLWMSLTENNVMEIFVNEGYVAVSILSAEPCGVIRLLCYQRRIDLFHPMQRLLL